MVNLLIVLLPLLAMILVALLIAALWFLWVSSRHRDEAEGEPDETLAAADTPGAAVLPGEHTTLEEQLAAAAAGEAGWADAPGSREGEPAGAVVEVMRVLRDEHGSLIVEVDGQRYRSLTEMGSEQVGQHFVSDAQALAVFAQLDDAQEAGDRALATVPQAAELPVVTAQPPAAAATSPPSQTGSLLQKGSLFSRGKVDVVEEEVDTRPIAEQIEELLQQRLNNTPELASRSVHIRAALDGSVRILVDGRIYEGVDEVTDDTVRQFIQETTRLWEARQ